MTSTAYDRADRKVVTIDAELNITSTVYDAAGRAIASIDANGNVTTTVYDAAGRRVALIDANGHATSFVYDDADRKINEVNADGGIITLAYDPANNLILRLDPRSQGATLTYDDANRLLLETYTDGALSTYTYDDVGNRLTSDSAAGIFTSTYDQRNQLASLAEPGGKTAGYTYDPASRRIALSAYGKGTFTYTWDAANRQTQVTTPTLQTTTMQYDPLARVIQRVYANGAITTQTFDPAGNLSGITNNGPLGLVSQLAYAYNNADQRIVQAENDGTLTTWTYDDAYRLINEHRSSGPTGTSFSHTHTYDPAGNRIAFNDGTTLTTYTYDPANRLELANAAGALTTYTNDSAGNRTETQTPTDSTLFTWDAAGRMVAAEPLAGVVSFTYNANGQRVAKQVPDGATGFLYDYKHLLHETDDIGGDITKTYSSTTDDEFGDLIGEMGEFSHQYDAQANTNALLDESGAVQAQYKYTAFGEVSATSVEGGPWTAEDWADLPPDLSTHMLAGGKKEYYLDPETALYLLGSGSNPGRYYDALTARFLSEDPTRQAGSGTNLFAYVNDNPVKHLDPSGHENSHSQQIQQAQGERSNAIDPNASSDASDPSGDASSSTDQGSTPDTPDTASGGGAGDGGTGLGTDSHTSKGKASDGSGTKKVDPPVPIAKRPVPLIPGTKQQNLAESSYYYNGQHYYVINGKAYKQDEVPVDATKPSGVFAFDSRPTATGQAALDQTIANFNAANNVSVANPRDFAYENGKLTYLIPGKEDTDATKAFQQSLPEGSGIGASQTKGERPPSTAPSSSAGDSGTAPTAPSPGSPATQPTTGGTGGGTAATGGAGIHGTGPGTGDGSGKGTAPASQADARPRVPPCHPRPGHLAGISRTAGAPPHRITPH